MVFLLFVGVWTARRAAGGQVRDRGRSGTAPPAPAAGADHAQHEPGRRGVRQRWRPWTQPAGDEHDALRDGDQRAQHDGERDDADHGRGPIAAASSVQIRTCSASVTSSGCSASHWTPAMIKPISVVPQIRATRQSGWRHLRGRPTMARMGSSGVSPLAGKGRGCHALARVAPPRFRQGPIKARVRCSHHRLGPLSPRVRYEHLVGPVGGLRGQDTVGHAVRRARRGRPPPQGRADPQADAGLAGGAPRAVVRVRLDVVAVLIEPTGPRR